MFMIFGKMCIKQNMYLAISLEVVEITVII